MSFFIIQWNYFFNKVNSSWLWPWRCCSLSRPDAAERRQKRKHRQHSLPFTNQHRDRAADHLQGLQQGSPQRQRDQRHHRHPTWVNQLQTTNSVCLSVFCTSCFYVSMHFMDQKKWGSKVRAPPGVTTSPLQANTQRIKQTFLLRSVSLATRLDLQQKLDKILQTTPEQIWKFHTDKHSRIPLDFTNNFSPTPTTNRGPGTDDKQ